MQIIVETFRAPGEKSISPIRVRPLPNQGLDISLRVECSRSMREAFPVGQLFCIHVKLTSRLGSPDFLYSNYRDSWNPVTKVEAKKFISSTYRMTD